MEKKNILFIVPAYFNNRPQSIRFRNIIKYLDYSKYNIHILFSGNENKYFVYGDSCNVHIVKTFWLFPFINSVYYPVQNNLSGYLRFFFKVIRFIMKHLILPDLYLFEIKKIERASKKIIKEHNIETIVASAKPFSLMKLLSKLKRTFNIKTIFDIGDPLFNNSAHKSLIKNFFYKRFENKYLPGIDILSVTNQETRNHYREVFGLSSDKIVVVPMGADIVENYVHISKKKYVEFKNEINLLYAGVFYKKLREPFQLYESIKAFNKNSEKVLKLNIYGPVPDYFKISDVNIVFHGAKEYSAIQILYNECDFIVHVDNNYGLQTPGKNFELIATGKPVLFLYRDDNSPTKKLFEGYNGSILIRNDFKNLVTGLNHFFNEQDKFSYITNIDISGFSWRKRSEIFAFSL